MRQLKKMFFTNIYWLDLNENLPRYKQITKCLSGYNSIANKDTRKHNELNQNQYAKEHRITKPAK